jgi:hypothetical protein
MGSMSRRSKSLKRTRDPVLADFYKDTVKPNRIISAVERARRLLEVGNIIEADRKLELLRKNLEFVASRIRYPYFRAGVKVKQAASNGGKRPRGTEARDRTMAAMFFEKQSAEQKKPFAVARRSDRQLTSEPSDSHSASIS